MEAVTLGLGGALEAPLESYNNNNNVLGRLRSWRLRRPIAVKLQEGRRAIGIR